MPNILFDIIFFIVSIASFLFLAIITPFPAAKPSALMTVGKSIVSKKFSAFFSLSKIEYFAVGTLCFLHIFFIKIFEDSSCEEALSGPKTAIFSSHNLSTIPLLRGSSGPTTTKSILCSLQKSTISALFIGSILKQLAIS